MTRIDIFSGFLGAGKTTLIKKLIKEAFQGEKLVLIENEFGEISIDGGFLKDAGVKITEMNSGCICCTLVGDFTKALKKVMDDYAPDRVIIEPSGVGKLSDIAKAVSGVEGAALGAKVTVVDAGRCRMYMRNFGEFFNDQVESADIIIMSRTDIAPESKVLTASKLLREHNPGAGLITTPWDKLSGEQLKKAMDAKGLEGDMEELRQEAGQHHEENEACACGHEHHQHDGGGKCSCGCGEQHHHHADEVFTSWGLETPRKFSREEMQNILEKLEDEKTYGDILRAKGIVDASDGEWIYFDYVPGESNIRRGSADVTGKICVIGSRMNEAALKELFEV